MKYNTKRYYSNKEERAKLNAEIDEILEKVSKLLEED